MLSNRTYSLLRDLNRYVNRVKSASLGSEGNDTSFEEMFAKVARSYLQDKAPALVPYDIGFQVVERNEDDTKALGVTGFKIHGSLLFSPVFFINGELKGHELLRMADQNLWIPLKEPWINEVFRKKPILIGEKNPKNDKAYSSPDLSELVYIPSKMASWIPKEFYPIYRDIASHAKKSMAKSASVLMRSINPINHIKSASFNGLQKLNTILTEYPLIKHAFDQIHPGGAKAIKDELDRRILLKTSLTNRVSMPYKRAEKYANAVRFVSYSVSISGSNLPLGLSDKEREKLLRDGFLVQDERDDDEVSSVVEYDNRMNTLQNPTTTGMYEVMTEPGKFKKMAVVYTNKKYFVIDPSSHDAIQLKNSEIWTTQKYPASDYIKWVNGLPTEDGGSDSIGSRNVLWLRGCCEAIDEPYASTILRTPKGSAFQHKKGTRETLHIPEDYHRLTMNMDRHLVVPVNALDYMTQKARKDRVKESAYRDLEHVKLLVKSGECTINNSHPMPLMDGLKKLITEYGLREKAAREVIKKATANTYHIHKFMVKRSDLETPPIPEIKGSNVSLLGGILPGGPSGMAISTHKSSDIDTDPRVTVDSDYAKQDAQAAQQAVQKGQKEIFDVSMLKSLYTVSDTDSIIDEHVTQLTKAMTEAGDLLFQFYWKGDQFREIYGPKNLPELESNLKKMFEILGDVVLFLKRNRLNKSDYEQMEPLDLGDNRL